MVMDLGKGGVAYDLKKETGVDVRRVRLTLTWPKNAGDGHDFDPDIVAFGVDDNGQVVNGDQAYFVKAFGAGSVPHSPDGSIRHVTGDAQGKEAINKEVIEIDVDKFAPGMTQADVATTIYKAASRGQNFGTFGKLRVLAENIDTGEEIGSGNLSLEQSAFTAALLLAVVKDGSKVYLQTNITGFNGGLAGLAQARGIQIGKNDYDN